MRGFVDERLSGNASKNQQRKMGNFIRTLRQKDTFYGDYITGFHVVHRAIERSFEKIEKSIRPDDLDRNIFAIQDKGFRRYVSLCIQFLSLHHKQEDKFIFPKFQSISSEFKEEVVNSLAKDHGAIELLLQEGIIILKAESNGDEVNEKDSTRERSKRLRDIAGQIQTLMPNHLSLEEKLITENFLREHLQLSEVYELHNLTHDMIDSDNVIVEGGERMDRKTSLVFLLYHLTEEERQFFDERLPFFLKWWLFPRWANVEGSEVFLHAPYCRLDTENNLRF